MQSVTQAPPVVVLARLVSLRKYLTLLMVPQRVQLVVVPAQPMQGDVQARH